MENKPKLYMTDGREIGRFDENGKLVIDSDCAIEIKTIATPCDHRVYIFDSGTQFMDWTSCNCERCKKSTSNDPSIGPSDMPKCEVEYALILACIGDGVVTPEIRRRAGADEEPTGRYVWPCLEVEWTEEWKAEYIRTHPEVNDEHQSKD